MTTLYYPNLFYARRRHPHIPLTVEIGHSSGFICQGSRCQRLPIHSSQYYNPRHQPNEPLIGIKCPQNQGAIRTYNRLKFLQDIRTLNSNARQPFGDVESEPARPPKRNRPHITIDMTDSKRPRQPCTGITGVSPHLGKAKNVNRQCTWLSCPDCCRAQRAATGNKCYTHESGSRAKAIPNTQPFLQTILENAEGSMHANVHTITPETAANPDLLGPAPPIHPLALSPSTMRTYHLNRSREEEAKREADAAAASCDRNISILLWTNATIEPIPFLFAPKLSKHYAISECEPLMMYLNATEPCWNKSLRVYNVKTDRWNITMVGTSIPMVTPLREALVTLPTVEPKDCHGMLELQTRLNPAPRTNIKHIVDSLRATPTRGSNASASPSPRSGSSHNSARQSPASDSPADTPNSIEFIVRVPSSSPSIDFPDTVNNHTAMAEPDTLPEHRGPIFQHNIFNKEPTTSLTAPGHHITRSSQAVIDLTENERASPKKQPNDSVIMVLPASDISPGCNDSSDNHAGSSPSPQPPNTTAPPTTGTKKKAPAGKRSTKSKRRTKDTGLWPTPSMPMRRLTEWHSIHVSTKGKQEVWEQFFSPEFKWNRTAMFRYIRWINEVTAERWEAWFKHCERNAVEAIFGTARLHFASELEAVG
ncbi:hypothetical protein DFH28DRAFT_912213 [Melampsora americana]|nr:hypothetical protein DFH28DRAFT_912213 [Melampsora americana]